MAKKLKAKIPAPIKKVSVSQQKDRILDFFNKSKKKPWKYDLILSICAKKDREAFKIALDELVKKGAVTEQDGRYELVVKVDKTGAFEGVVTRLLKNFGFASIDKVPEGMSEIAVGGEVFIPGRCMLGAMPGDRVLLKVLPPRIGKPSGKSQEIDAEVVKIIEENFKSFAGKVVYSEGQLKILTKASNEPFLLRKGDVQYADGDKVLCEIVRRGKRHSEHVVKAIFNFGDAATAEACSEAVVMVNGISKEFPADVLAEAKKIAEEGITADDIKNRLDLRDMPIFTIDGAHTKDIDDAVSLEKTENGWNLGVHIADVSHYVKPHTALDNDAYRRGTSVYYADQVVPMLPKELSNGICSLNPNEDRLAFSCFAELDKKGRLRDYTFKKTVIKSRVKGVYSEINLILAGAADAKLKKKYTGLLKVVKDMDKLSDILTQNRFDRGAPEIDGEESEIIIENGVCTGICARERGKSERIIEELMLTANECAAKMGAKLETPFVYRVHDKPNGDRLDELKTIFANLGLNFPNPNVPNGDVQPSHIKEILGAIKGTPYEIALQNLTLRCMAKAKYSSDPIGHFGLALKDYAHFTSPIRRYPDLAVHRILTDLIDGKKPSEIQERYETFASNTALHSSAAEVNAVQTERECEKHYKAEFMSNFLGEEFDGVICSIVDYGFFVHLSNSVEGFIHVRDLNDDNYAPSGGVCLKGAYSGKEFKIGDNIKVQCVRADVNSGMVDFRLIP